MLPKHNKTDGFERPVLCDEKIFQFGDAIAIVAADTEEHARAAAEAVKVEIEELPAYMNAGTAFRIHSRLRSNLTVHVSLIFILSRTAVMVTLTKTV